MSHLVTRIGTGCKSTIREPFDLRLLVRGEGHETEGFQAGIIQGQPEAAQGHPFSQSMLYTGAVYEH
jgi:hypothetical protein